MNVDPPSPSESGENLPRQTRDAANGAPSGLRGQTTKTLTDAPARLPKRIGQYHIKSIIASGGMGTVYEAIQEKPRRTVALKLMKQRDSSLYVLRKSLRRHRTRIAVTVGFNDLLRRVGFELRALNESNPSNERPE